MPSNAPLSRGMVKQDTMGYFTTLPDIKRIYVYLNGDSHHSATTFIVHPRRIRSYEVFLADLTEKLRPGFGAIRNVYTPVNGSRVRDLEDLENHQRYVVAGCEAFRKLKYADIDMTEAKRRANRRGSKITRPPLSAQNRVHKTIRRRPYGWEAIHIFVYKNGDDVTPPVRISVRRSELDNWEHVLLRISDRLDQSGFVKRLYNLNGDWVRGPNSIKNGQYYVAVSGYGSFKQVMYGKLLDKLPQEFLRPSPPIRKVRTNPKKTNAHKKVVPKIIAPNVSKKQNTKPAAGHDNSSSNKEYKATKDESSHTRRTFNSTSKPSVGHHDKKETTVDGDPKDPIRTKTAMKPLIRSPYISNTSQPKTTSNTTEHKETHNNFSPNSNEKNTLPRRASIRKVPTKSGNDGGVVVLKSANSRKSPPDSEDSAYISENERWERRRRSKTDDMLRPRSFKVLDDRPAAAHGDRVYYAPSTKKPSQKRVTLVDYDEDAGGVYKAKAPSGERRHTAEVPELENVPVELPIDEVEATEVGEESDEDDYDDEEEEEDDYYRRMEQQQRHHSPVAHKESDLRSSAKTAS